MRKQIKKIINKESYSIKIFCSASPEKIKKKPGPAQLKFFFQKLSDLVQTSFIIV